MRRIREQQHAFMKNIYTIINNGIEARAFREVDPCGHGELIYSAIIGLSRWSDESIEIEPLARDFKDLFIHGIVANKAN